MQSHSVTPGPRIRAAKGRERHASIREHQRRYADSLPDGRYEIVDSAHLLQAEQSQLLAARIRQLLRSDGVWS
jgi:hypothetical protein